MSVYDIVRYLGAATIAGLPHPRSISQYRLIDKNPTVVHLLLIHDRDTVTHQLITEKNISGPEVLFKTCVAMKFVDDDDDDE